MTGPSRKIIARPDLPRSFAVIESASYREAVQDMRDAFACRDTHLVVWNRAAELVTDRMREDIEKLRQARVEVQRLRDLNKTASLLDLLFHRRESPAERLHRNFNAVAAKAGLSSESFKDWEEDSRSVAAALQAELNPSTLDQMVRARAIDRKPFLHYDFAERPGSFVALRTLSGDPTEYYDPEDCRGEQVIRVGRSARKVQIVKGDAARWRPGPLALVFHSGKILHSAPSAKNEPLAAGQFRVNEFFLVTGGKDTVSCHNQR